MHHSRFFPHRGYALLALLACTLFLAAPAQADPAGRIGRIGLISGSVNLYNADTGESLDAPLNQPLTSGDVLTTDAGSRTEIQIGSITVRLDSGSRLELDRIDDEQVRLYLDKGRSIVKLSSPDAARDFVMETPNGKFTPRSSGIYRFDSDADGSSGSAYHGSLHFENSDSELDIGAGQNARFWQDGQTRYRLSTAPNDDFTQWSAARDQRPAARTYTRYVSPEMTGAEDLDAYGHWSETPEYGAIWTPRVVTAGWAPFRSGHWAWVAPWGWTWVGNEPWGFAPFHYGRWVHHHGAWGWVPGKRVARPVYAPAMVAWIGSPGIGVSIAIGSRPAVGWFPLAPREVYIPAYRSSAKHIRNINITHVTHINNVTSIVNNPQAVVQKTRYSHRGMPRAVTFVPADVVTHRRSVAAEALSPRDHRTLRDQPIRATAPVAGPQAAPRVESRHRQERRNPAFNRPDREQRTPAVATPSAPRNIDVTPSQPAPQTPVVTNQRNERPRPEVGRPAPQARVERVEPRRQEAPAPMTAPQSPPPTETRNRPDRRDHTFARPDRDRPAPVVAAPTIPRNRDVAPSQPAPTPQAVIIQRNERPRSEVVRPATQPRPEPVAQRVQERHRNIEPTQRQQAREIRAEPVQRPSPQPPPPRVERPAPAPREVHRPAEQARPDARIQRHQAERQRPARQNEQEILHRRNDAEKR